MTIFAITPPRVYLFLFYICLKICVLHVHCSYMILFRKVVRVRFTFNFSYIFTTKLHLLGLKCERKKGSPHKTKKYYFQPYTLCHNTHHLTLTQSTKTELHPHLIYRSFCDKRIIGICSRAQIYLGLHRDNYCRLMLGILDGGEILWSGGL